MQIKNKKIKTLIFVFFGVIITAGIFYSGYTLGFAKKTSNQSQNNQKNFGADFSLFWETVDLIKNKYIGSKEVKDQDLLYGAINGAVKSLDDPYSLFLNPSDSKKFEEDITGSFGGIGAEIGIRNNQLMIITPLKNNPAEKAGLKAGDKILKIDDTFTNDLQVDEAVKIIRGEPDSEVKMLVLRDDWEEPKEFKVIRKIIVIPTLEWEMKPGGIAYFELYNFNANVPSLFYQAALSALLKGANGVILDLRNNPGGFLEVAVDVSGWFMDKGDPVVIEKFQSGDQRVLRARGSGALKNIPTVVLVNGGSASAAEIVAGALRDNNNIKLIGEKTFGKGTVQEITELKDGSSLKVSIAEWLTPKGNQINKKGLAPDFEVKLIEEDVAKGNDSQLEKAIKILNSK